MAFGFLKNSENYSHITSLHHKKSSTHWAAFVV